MIIYIEDQSLDKFQVSCRAKIISQLGTKGNFLNCALHSASACRTVRFNPSCSASDPIPCSWAGEETEAGPGTGDTATQGGGPGSCV